MTRLFHSFCCFFILAAALALGTVVIDFDVTRGRLKWESTTIPFAIDDTSLLPNETRAVRSALRTLESKTCLRFVEDSSPTYHISFIRAPKRIGRVCKGGLGKSVWLRMVGFWKCYSKPGYILHEVMHMLGFLHEHQREDRDQHIQVAWENIEQPLRPLFTKYNYTDNNLPSTTLGTPYDIKSIMHYEAWRYDEHRSRIIYALDPNIQNEEIGQKDELSVGDIAAINEVYCRPKTV